MANLTDYFQNSAGGTPISHTYSITNAGAESGAMTGWTAGVGTGFETLTTGAVSGLNPRTGTYFFGGGNQLESSSYQDITAVAGDVTSALIDLEKLLLMVTYYDASFNGNDRVRMYMDFYDGAPGSQITDNLNTYEPLAAGTALTWNKRKIYAIAPTGTRTIRLYMHGYRYDGVYCNAHIDDIEMIGMGIA